jgi:hypothetical protein
MMSLLLLMLLVRSAGLIDWIHSFIPISSQNSAISSVVVMNELALVLVLMMS